MPKPDPDPGPVPPDPTPTGDQLRYWVELTPDGLVLVELQISQQRMRRRLTMSLSRTDAAVLGVDLMHASGLDSTHTDDLAREIARRRLAKKNSR
jgi:hypothetical protein